MKVLKMLYRTVNHLVLAFHLLKISVSASNLFLRIPGRSQKDPKGDQHPTKAGISLFHWARCNFGASSPSSTSSNLTPNVSPRLDESVHPWQRGMQNGKPKHMQQVTLESE